MFVTNKMLLFTVVIIASLTYLTACKEKPLPESKASELHPLTDSLINIFKELKEAAITRKSDKFLSLIDSTESIRLQALTKKHGFGSLRTYLESQYANWPDPDTLRYNDLIITENYARLTLLGHGGFPTSRDDILRWTFILYRRNSEGWKLAGISNLEKDHFDQYGIELEYFETELPPKLRFPRLF